MVFLAWEETADGWFERRPITLGRAGDHLVAGGALGASVALLDSVRDVACDYLLEPGGESRWVRTWVSPVSAPLAVRLRIRRTDAEGTDTLLFLIKERG